MFTPFTPGLFNSLYGFQWDDHSPVRSFVLESIYRTFLEGVGVGGEKIG